jgi:tRNA-dihydrouridine synthase A
MVCKHDKKHVQIAPMLAITDQHFRRFFRGISNHVELWTEMHVDATLLHSTNLKEVLFCDPLDHPVVCQLGGSQSETLANAASVACQWGYKEINLNCGCPSARVATKGCFGASLMKKPDTVADIVNKIHRTVGSHIPVSIKCRTGVDHDYDSFTHLNNFVRTVSQKSECTRFIIHARKAWLSGLNPKKNRSLPPLQYHRVYQLAYLHPKLNITLNGGVTSIEDIQKLLSCQWRPPSSNFNSLPTTSNPPYENKREPSDSGIEKQSLKSNTIENEQFNTYVHKPSEPITFTTFNEVKKHSLLDSSILDNVIPYDTRNPIYLDDLSYEDAYSLMNTLETSMKQDASKNYLQGIMIGRMAFNQPCLFSCIDSMFYDSYDPLTARTPRTLAVYYEDYLNTFYPDCESTTSIYTLLKPTLGLLSGRPGCKLYRQSLEKIIRQEGSILCAGDILAKALVQVDEQFPGVLDSPNKTVCAEKSIFDTFS